MARIGTDGPAATIRIHPATEREEDLVKPYRSITLTLFGLAVSASLALVGTALSSGPAAAVVYCQYIDYPPSCIARPGVVLRPRPVARAAAREAVRPGTPMNRGGPVNRVGRR